MRDKLCCCTGGVYVPAQLRSRQGDLFGQLYRQPAIDHYGTLEVTFVVPRIIVRPVVKLDTYYMLLWLLKQVRIYCGMVICCINE